MCCSFIQKDGVRFLDDDCSVEFSYTKDTIVHKPVIHELSRCISYA